MYNFLCPIKCMLKFTLPEQNTQTWLGLVLVLYTHQNVNKMKDIYIGYLWDKFHNKHGTKYFHVGLN